MNGNQHTATGDDKSRTRFTIEVNGVACTLIRARIGSAFCWVGWPHTKDGRETCRYPLVIEADGTIRSSGAVNFMAMGGWGQGFHQRAEGPAAQAKAAILQDFMRVVTAPVSSARRETDREDIKADLEKRLGPGFYLEDGAETDPNLETLAAVPLEVLLQAEANNFGVKMHTQILLGRLVNPNFVSIEEGAWSADAELLAVLSGWTAADVALAQHNGLTLTRVARVDARRSKKAA